MEGNIMNFVRSPRLSDQAVSGPIDPRTGDPVRPLGVVGGRLVWPIMGASPDDPSNEDDEKETEEEDDDPEGGSNSKDGGKGDPDAKIAALAEEKDRHVRRRQEAERERDEAKQRLAELEGKDKTDLEKAQSRVTELESENEALHDSLRTTRLENAFLTDNSYEWHNPRRALSLADLSEVEIDDDGKVHGLKQALDALAKSDAYLLKSKKGDETEDEEQVSTGGRKQPSKKKKAADADDEALRQKYSALQR